MTPSEHDNQPESLELRSLVVARRVVRDVLAPLDPPPVDGGSADRIDVPGYAIHAKIGAGATSEVFRATRLANGQTVAIKVLRRTGAVNWQWVWHELDLLGQVRLACLPRLLDYGEVDGRLFLVTDFVDGTPIDHRCAELDLDTAERIDLLADVADCVHALHEVGIIHRDLKPSNILIDPGGRPVIVDLGIAQRTGSEARAPVEAAGAAGDASGPSPPDPDTPADGTPDLRHLVGTPDFMSPEQARGEATVGVRSDVYALGAIGYVLCTGHPAHAGAGSARETVARILSGAAPPPRSRDGRVPRVLSAILHKAVSFEPEDRYASAAALADDLRRWRRREPVDVGTAGPLRTIHRWLYRHPLAATAAACLMLVGLTAVGIAISLDILNRRPFHLEVTDDRAYAILRSQLGSDLYEWGGGRPGDIRHASLNRSSGRPLAVIAFDQPFAHDGAGEVHVYDARHPERLVWRGAVDDGDLPPVFEGHDAASYGSHHVLEADVFADRRGEELIVQHHHGVRSARLVRIYALADGEVLFEAWHDGNLPGMHWLPEPKVLLLAGRNQEARWERRGCASTSFPLIVCGVRPRLGWREDRLLTDLPEDSPLQWYKVLVPCTRAEAMVAGLLYPPHVNDDPGREARFGSELAANRDAAFSWRIDADGRLADLISSDDLAVVAPDATSGLRLEDIADHSIEPHEEPATENP